MQLECQSMAKNRKDKCQKDCIPNRVPERVSDGFRRCARYSARKIAGRYATWVAAKDAKLLPGESQKIRQKGCQKNSEDMPDGTLVFLQQHRDGQSCQKLCQRLHVRTSVGKHCEHISEPRSKYTLRHMSDFRAGQLSELMPTRTSEHSPEQFAALMTDDVSDDVSEHIPNLMPELVSEHCVNAHVRQHFSG